MAMKMTRLTKWIVMLGLCITGISANAVDPREIEADAPPLLKQNPEYQWSDLHWAARLGRVEDVQRLAAQSAQRNARDFQGRTPLHIAVLAGHNRAVEALLAAGADVNARDQWGITPLRRAELTQEIRGWDRAAIKDLLRAAGGTTEQIMPRR